MQHNLQKSLGITNSTIKLILNVLLEAGQIALKYHGNSTLKVEYKEDQTPVTNADIEVNDFILKHLAKITPDIFVVSEENKSNDFTGDVFWLLDPIDGTKQYINGTSGYTINLALISKHQPVIGFVYHPSLKEIYYNDFDGEVILYDVASNKQSMHNQIKTGSLIRVLINDNQRNIDRADNDGLFFKVNCTPSRNKVSMILNHEVDVYYIYRQIMEWDTAAGHAILKSLGGEIIDMQGNVLVYGKPLFINPSIIVCSQSALNEKKIILDNI